MDVGSFSSVSFFLIWGGPGSNLAVHVNRAIDDRPRIQQEAICYQ